MGAPEAREWNVSTNREKSVTGWRGWVVGQAEVFPDGGTAQSKSRPVLLLHLNKNDLHT